MAGGQLNAVDPDTALAEWQGDTSGADAQFEGAPYSGQIGEEVHRRVEDRRLEHVGRVLVVAFRSVFVELDLRHEGIVRDVRRDAPGLPGHPVPA
jgi:hypothetical protein